MASQIDTKTLLYAAGGIAVAGLGFAGICFAKRARSKPKVKPTLTYFNGRGLAELSRLCLAEAGFEYEDKRITDDEMKELKGSGVLPFRQVPIYREGDLVLAQSTAIARYIAELGGFRGSCRRTRAKADMVVEAVADVNDQIRQWRYRLPEPERPAAKAKFEKEYLPQWLENLEKLLEQNGAYYADGKFTYADLAIFSKVMELQGVFPDVVKRFKRVTDHANLIAARPRIAEWLLKRPQTDF
jgi:glutathione S-transferase